MKESLIELVDVIVRRIQERPGKPPSESSIRTWLARQGYTAREINAALRLARPRLSGQAPRLERAPTTVRLLSAFEETKLSPEARQVLARLELYGLVEPYEREMVLDYLHHAEGVVGLDELDYLLSWMVCSNRDVGFQQTFYNVFEGKGDTVN